MAANERVYIGGIEGGGTHSLVVILDQDGTKLSEAEGPSTNAWLIGMNEARKRIADLVTAGKELAGIDPNIPLHALGLSLSGGDSIECRREMEEGMRRNYPNVANSYVVTCDTIGSVATASGTGGICLISGTGSNCQLVNPGGDSYRCGGWGHLLGDEGSAYWISQYVLKQVFDDMDNLNPCPHDITVAKDIMFSHFNIKDQMGLLEYLYTNFEKSRIASMTRLVAQAAKAQNDSLCQSVFHKAGQLLGRHVLALLPKADQVMLDGPGGLHVVCVGSVFKSWDLLQEGFLDGLKPRSSSDVQLKEITLLQCLKPATYGAAYLACKAANIKMDVNYKENVQVLFHKSLNSN